MDLLSMIERELISSDVQSIDAIDGILVTTPVPDGRCKLGAQLVKLLIQHCLTGESKWQSVILVGTKSDRATAEEIEHFKTQIVPDFFACAPGGIGAFALTSKHDYSPLRRAIANLPASKVQYCTTSPSEMAQHFAHALGIEKELFEQQLLHSREALQAELEAQFAERELAMKSEIQRLQKAQEEQSMKLSQESDRLQTVLSERLAEKDALIDQCRKAGPSERKALEEQLARAKEQIRQAEHDHIEKQRLWDRQIESKTESIKQLMRRLEDKENQMSRNYALPAPRFVQSCLHPRSRNWGNKHGKGRKCIECGAELGRF
jgi:hypothetical protein